MGINVISPSYDRTYTAYAWRDNNIQLVLVQGEGATSVGDSETTVEANHIKDPRFQLRDDRGFIDLTDCTEVSLALSRPDGSEDLLACVVDDTDGDKGVISCPITASATSVAGKATGEIWVISTNGILKFGGIHVLIYDGVSADAAAQSTHFSALIAALQKVAVVDPDGSNTVTLDEAIVENGTNPVASGVIYDYLVDNYYTKTESDNRYYQKSQVYTKEEADDAAKSTIDAILSGEDEDVSLSLVHGELVYTNADGDPISLGDASDTFYTKDQMDKVILGGSRGIINPTIFDGRNERVASYFDDNPTDYTDYSSEGGNTPYTVTYIPDPSGENAVQRNENADKPNSFEIENLPANTAKIILRDIATGHEWADTVSGGSYIVKNLIPNHVYGYIAMYSNNSIVKTGSLIATGKTRMIDAGDNVDETDPYNIRDIGGWACDGGTIRYGLLFRGSELDGNIELTTAQKSVFTNVLGIQEEIDLRETASSGSVLGVSYFHKSLRYYINAINSASRLADTVSVIKRIAKNVSEQKPTYVHCQSGADRTATLLMFIEAICGVSQSDIDRDFELTSFSFYYSSDREAWEQVDRRRSNGTFGGGYANWKNLMEYIKTLNNEATFNAKIIRFLMENGVSADEINAIRYGLIDGTPSYISPLGTATVTPVLTGAQIDNDALVVELGQPYRTTLSVNSMYQLTTLGITMGGTNITSSCYDNGRIYIPCVTGNITIVATAVDVSTQVASITIPSSGWSNGAYNIDSLMPAGVSAKSKVDVSIGETTFTQLLADGCIGLYVNTDTQNTPKFTLYAIGNTPTADITIQLFIQKLANV